MNLLAITPANRRLAPGPEILSQAFVDLCREHQVETRYIQPGKPNQNAFIERFNRTFRHEGLDAWWFPAVLFAYLSGWRKSEVLGLTWDRVDFAAGVVRLEPGTTKNDEGRTLPFEADPELAGLLLGQRERSWVLERQTGREARASGGRPPRDLVTILVTVRRPGRAAAQGMGWMTGIEPATPGATVQCSTG